MAKQQHTGIGYSMVPRLRETRSHGHRRPGYGNHKTQGQSFADPMLGNVALVGIRLSSDMQTVRTIA